MIAEVICSSPVWSYESEDDKDIATSGGDKRGMREVRLGISQWPYPGDQVVSYSSVSPVG